MKTHAREQIAFLGNDAPVGYYTADPHHHDGLWHQFYATGRMVYCNEFGSRVAADDSLGASKVPYEEGEGHAVGRTLFDPKFHPRILN